MVTRKYAAWGAIGTLLFTASMAGADVKYNRKTRDIKVEQTEATKKLEKKAPDKKEKEPDSGFSADDFMAIEAAVEDINDQLIDIYKQQLESSEDDDDRRAEYAFRLAEAYSQKVRFNHFKGMEALIKADKAKKKADKDKLLREKGKYDKEKQKWLVEAVKIYKLMVESKSKVFKKFARMDEVLFYFAFTLSQAGYHDQARDQYKALLKDYQSSRFIPDAYLAFAEWYFENKEFPNAEAFYDKVLKFPKSSVYPYAMYKKGWVYFNQNRYDDAMKAFFATVQLTKDDTKNEPMNRAAKKDFVRMYSEIGDPKLAYKAFERVDPKYAFQMLIFLSDYYIDQGKADKAIYTLREMIGMKGEDKRVCEWQSNVVRAMLTIGKQEEKVREIRVTNELYTFLAQGKKIPAANLAECRDNAQSVNSELAKLWHVEGLKTLNPDTLGYAHMLYKLYQKHFPDAEDSADMQFNYAELVWKRAEMEKNSAKQGILWEEAAEEYRRVVEMRKVEPKLLKEAAYATVLAWKNALAIDPSTERPDEAKDTDKIPEERPIPDKEKKMMDAFDIYLTYIKDNKDDERVLITFLKGRIYWKYNHFNEAIPLFEEVITTRPDHETAEFSANLLLDSLNRSQKYEQLIAWVDKFLDPRMSKFIEEHAEIGDTVKKLKRQSRRKLAEKLEKDKKWRECGFAYEDMYNVYGTNGGDDMPEIMFNAAVCFENAKLIGRAIAFRGRLVKEHPKTNLAQKAQYALGLNYAQIAWYDQAAEMFEAYANKFGGEKDAIDALQNATFFRKGLGQDEKAIKDTEYFIRQYGTKQPKKAAAAHFAQASIYEKNKAWDQYTKHLANYLKQWGGKGGVDRQIQAHVKIGEVRWRESCPVKGVNESCIETKRERALKQPKKKKGRKSKPSDDLPTQCGDPSKLKVIVHKRNPGKMKEAQNHFNAALKLWKGGDAIKDVPGETDTEKAARAAEAIFWVGAANYYLAEEKFETFLTLQFPEKLDFSIDEEHGPKKKKDSEKRKKESEKKFKKYLEDKQKTLVTARERYMSIINGALEGGAAINAANWAIRGAARYGQLYQNFSDQLFTAEIPKDVRTGEFAEDAVAAFCDTLTEQADPLEEESVKGFAFCLETSTKLNWFNDWTKLCEGELAQIRPQDFPSAGEIRSKPEEIPMTLDTQPIVTEIQTTAPKTSQAPAGGATTAAAAK